MYAVFKFGLLLAIVVSVGLGSIKAQDPGKATYWAFVGTGKKAIYRAEWDPATGKLTTPVVAAETASPTFVTLSPNKKFLYCVNEVNMFDGKKGGAVSAFAVDAKTGDLKFLNQESVVTAGPCHVSVDRSGKFVLAANYSGGSICVLPVKEDGSLSPYSDFVQHKGASAAKGHSIQMDASNKFAVVTDLGLDQTLVYKFDAAKGKLTPNEPPFIAAKQGAGPRHLAFHPNQKFIYVINELDSTMTAMSFDSAKGQLAALQTLSTLPAEYKGPKNSCAEVEVHSSGKFVYGSNRGHNSIALFKLDPDKGTMTFVAHQNESIKTPRHFAIDPTGKYLIVANQAGNDLVVFGINQTTGELTPTGNRVEVSTPECVIYLAKS